MQVEIRHLRSLLAVYEHGSVTKAAGALGLSQPALTTQLRRIEAMVGGEVFRRDHRGAVPTSFGDFVLSRARAAVAAVDDLVDAKPRDSVTRLRVGGFDSPMLLDLLERVDELMIGVEVSVHSEYSVRLLSDMVASRRLDCALVADYPGHRIPTLPRIKSAEIGSNPVFVALPADHRAAALADVPLAEVADCPLIVPPSDGIGWPEHFLDVFAEHGLTANVAHQLTEISLCSKIIAAGRGVLLCQPNFPESREVTVRPLAGDPLWMRYLLVWHDAGSVAPYAEELARTVRDRLTVATKRAPAYADWLLRRTEQGGVPRSP